MEESLVEQPLDPMLKELNRLVSFPLIWGLEFGYTKSELAKDGIYCDHSRSQYKCVFCKIGIDVFSKDESVRIYHSRISLYCPIVTGNAKKNQPLDEICDLRLGRHRLVTFYKTSWTAPVDPYDLAEWGFYRTGEKEACCWFCGTKVPEWSKGDKAEIQHRRYFRHCTVFQEGGGRDNVKLGKEDSTLIKMTNLTGFLQNPKNGGTIYLVGTESNVSSEELGVSFNKEPVNPEFSTKAVRLSTYTFWPICLSQQPEKLADAGFFYTGRSDCVRCYHCNGVLRDWNQGDLPWICHALSYPHCQFLFIKMGREFVNRVKATNEANRHISDLYLPSIVEAKAALSTCKTASSTNTNEGAGGQSDTNDVKVSDSRACKVCFLKEIGIVFLPCSHTTSCPDCATQLTACPICRARIRALVRVFLP